MLRQKGPQIALSDPDHATNTMHDQVAVFDPPVNRTGGDVETFRHLDRTKEPGAMEAQAPLREAENANWDFF